MNCTLQKSEVHSKICELPPQNWIQNRLRSRIRIWSVQALVQTILKWFKMVKAERGWSRLVQAGPDWSRLVQTGPNWSRLVEGANRNSLDSGLTSSIYYNTITLDLRLL